MYIIPKWRSSDRQLMRLQRAETLWKTLISSVIIDEKHRSEELDKLDKKIEDKWKRIYVNKPVWP